MTKSPDAVTFADKIVIILGSSAAGVSMELYFKKLFKVLNAVFEFHCFID
jgi:hypothetical protein